jgi:hypothetical protein
MKRIILPFFLLLASAATAQTEIIKEASLPVTQLSFTQLPSEIYLQAAIQPVASALTVTAVDHELLFAPTPPGGGTGGGGGVGEAPVTDCLWILIVCCLIYGLYMRGGIFTRKQTKKRTNN